MELGDEELTVMQRLGSLIESLPTLAARRRAATWVFQRYAEDSEGRHSDVAIRSSAPSQTVTQFVAESSPAFKADRLLLLVESCRLSGEPEPHTSHLNDLNRQAGGDAFAEAASLAVPLIERGLLKRPQPGRLRLTEKGQRAVQALRTRGRG